MRFVSLVILGITTATLFGKEHCEVKDSNIVACKNIKSFFSKGHTKGHIRNFTMSTINEGALKDYWANATGGALAYETMRFKGISFGVKGIFTFNTASSDLLEIDSLAGKASKWEVELFDINRPEEKHDLDRLEELFIQYKNAKHNVTFGRQILNTPLVNASDGRMKPFVFTGLYGIHQTAKKWEMHYAWIYGVSPRSTTHFYSLEEAIGMNNNGYNLDGTKANYSDHISTKGLGIFALKGKVSDQTNVQIWNYHLDQINHTIWTQIDHKFNSFYGGIQYIHQFSMQEDGLDIDYFHHPDQKTNIIALKAGKKFDHFDHSLSYSRGSASGRFVFPRELGRDRLYTSIPRAWLEGKGNNNAIVWSSKYVKRNRNYLKISNGYYFGLDKNDSYHNKYEEADCYQFNIDINYSCHGAWEGLELHVLYLYKHDLHDSTELAEAFNKTNYHQINLIGNIKI